MTFTLTFECDNDAFAPNPVHEIARILVHVADTFGGRGESSGTVRDINGNTVGRWELS